MVTTNQAETIATALGDITKDDAQLQQEITRLNRRTVVPLEHVRDLHNWLDEKRKARQSCRLVGESRTGKTVACDSYKLRNKPLQKGHETPKVPVVYIMLPTKCGAKELFKEIIEALRYKAVRGTVSDFRSRAMDVLKACDVEMLIIDEADRLINLNKNVTILTRLQNRTCTFRFIRLLNRLALVKRTFSVNVVMTMPM